MPWPVHAQAGEEVESKSVQWESLPRGELQWYHLMQGYCFKELFASEGQAGVAACLKGCTSPVNGIESISVSSCHSGPRSAEVTQLLATEPQISL